MHDFTTIDEIRDFSANASAIAHSCLRFAESGEVTTGTLDRSSGENIGRAGLITCPRAVEVEKKGRCIFAPGDEITALCAIVGAFLWGAANMPVFGRSV
jgi:hypothetical protein